MDRVHWNDDIQWDYQGDASKEITEPLGILITVSCFDDAMQAATS